MDTVSKHRWNYTVLQYQLILQVDLVLCLIQRTGSASQTVGHGLGVAPNVIISKNRTDGGATYGNWVVYHSSLATANDTNNFIKFNCRMLQVLKCNWEIHDPTSTVYSVHDKWIWCY
jgi:hypothetical protein